MIGLFTIFMILLPIVSAIVLLIIYFQKRNKKNKQ